MDYTLGIRCRALIGAFLTATDQPADCRRYIPSPKLDDLLDIKWVPEGTDENDIKWVPEGTDENDGNKRDGLDEGSNITADHAPWPSCSYHLCTVTLAHTRYRIVITRYGGLCIRNN